MRIEHSADLNVTLVVLSRRNLLVLLAKLDGHPPGSACTIYKDNVAVKAEEDSAHYVEAAPGNMHPETEEALANVPHKNGADYHPNCGCNEGYKSAVKDWNN